jgi:hypothetical protein
VAEALVGHGAYGAILASPSWFSYFAVLGITELTVASTNLLSIVGGADIALGLVVLVLPIPALLVFLAAWKIFTEALRPAVGEPFWEFVERASKMLAPLALLYVRGRPVRLTPQPGRRLLSRAVAVCGFLPALDALAANPHQVVAGLGIARLPGLRPACLRVASPLRGVVGDGCGAHGRDQERGARARPAHGQTRLCTGGAPGDGPDLPITGTPSVQAM